MLGKFDALSQAGVQVAVEYFEVTGDFSYFLVLNNFLR